MPEFYNVFTDGGSRGNPGPGGVGVVIEKCLEEKCQVVAEKHKFLGTTTNNQAEYQAVILALSEINKLKINKPITFHLDSRLVVEQVNGNYKVKHPGLIPLLSQVYHMIDSLPQKPHFISIPRERNKRADKLANQAMDEGVMSVGE